MKTIVLAATFCTALATVSHASAPIMRVARHPAALPCNPEQLRSRMATVTVLALCGKPAHVTYSGFLEHLREQWSYGPRLTLYFENKMLADMQWKE